MNFKEVFVFLFINVRFLILKRIFLVDLTRRVIHRVEKICVLGIFLYIILIDIFNIKFFILLFDRHICIILFKLQKLNF